MTRSRRLLSLCLAAGTVMTLTGAGAASAAVKPGVARLQQRGNDAINQRLTTLNELTGEVTAARYLTAPDRAILLGQIAADIAGLTRLKATIDADTNPATLVPEVVSIVTAYRVYVELEPKVHLIRGADFVLQIAGTITPIEPKLQAALAARHDPGTTAAVYADLVAKVAAAEQLVSGLSGRLAALVPSQYPSPAQATLKAARQAIGAAAADLRQARSDLGQLRDALEKASK
jgi:hypothetical protein